MGFFYILFNALFVQHVPQIGLRSGEGEGSQLNNLNLRPLFRSWIFFCSVAGRIIQLKATNSIRNYTVAMVSDAHAPSRPYNVKNKSMIHQTRSPFFAAPWSSSDA